MNSYYLSSSKLQPRHNSLPLFLQRVRENRGHRSAKTWCLWRTNRGRFFTRILSLHVRTPTPEMSDFKRLFAGRRGEIAHCKKWNYIILKSCSSTICMSQMMKLKKCMQVRPEKSMISHWMISLILKKLQCSLTASILAGRQNNDLNVHPLLIQTLRYFPRWYHQSLYKTTKQSVGSRAYSSWFCDQPVD